MEKKLVKCSHCEKEQSFNGASCNKLGWYCKCEKCGRDFDINITEYLVPRGIKVRLIADGRIGIIDGNDKETTDEFYNINYYFCDEKYTNEKVWSSHYEMLLRSEFEVIK